MNLAGLITVARGLAPADLIIKNSRVINVFNGEIERGDVAIYQGYIAGIGEYSDATNVIDAKGGYLAPGLIDGHVHPESSYLSPGQYARAVVPKGTTAIITDLHEVTNVGGLPGMRYYMEAARKTPLDVFFMAPSCVPCSPLETSGAELTAKDLKKAMRWNSVIGLGEMMNFPGIIFGDEDILAKVSSAHEMGGRVDGHAPGLSGKDLQGYLAAGIYSDHECVHLAEARGKLARGMYIMIREGSSEKNLEDLLSLVTDKTYPRCLLVVDDRTCLDIQSDGDMDAVVRKAIQLGLDEVRAVQLATINPALYFGLKRRGAVAPGYIADLLLIEDLKDFRAAKVFKGGKLVAEEGKPLFSARESYPEYIAHTLNVKPFDISSLAVPSKLDPFPVIEVIPGQIVTGQSNESLHTKDGSFVSDISRDILKIVVVERHKGTGNIGVAFIKGFGLKRGAIGSTVAHDSHNIVVVGASDRDIYAAVQEIIRLEGGLVVTSDSKVIESLALPIAGLLSPQPLEEAAAKLDKLQKAAAELGCSLPSPFATLSFMALPVIPSLKLTDRGLVDVNKFEFVDIGR